MDPFLKTVISSETKKSIIVFEESEANFLTSFTRTAINYPTVESLFIAAMFLFFVRFCVFRG